MKIVERQIAELKPAHYNPRKISDADFEQLKKSLEKFEAVEPVIINRAPGREDIIVGGHQRLKAARALGWATFPCVEVHLTEAEERELNIRLNKNTGEWDLEALLGNFSLDDLTDFGFAADELFDIRKDVARDNRDMTQDSIPLAAQFLVPPFSVLDSRKGAWQSRKREWKSKIGDNGESREGTLIGGPTSIMYQNNDAGVSLLDPVLAELAVKWFAPTSGGAAFDCFAGDSVFGWVASALGMRFTGIELREEQARLNNERVANIPGTTSRYICDDGQNVAKHLDAKSQDFLFSCPPYFDLEVYSDLPNDASNQKSYEGFLEILRNAFTQACGCLRENRFAVIVVGDVRGKNGAYLDFPGDIVRIFEGAGLHLYNQLILVEPASSIALRVRKYMESRKIGKVHQNVFVFYKGDPRKVKNHFEPIEIPEQALAAAEQEETE
jgi:hypothetical protein